MNCAHGLNVTSAPLLLRPSTVPKSGLTRTSPVNVSRGPGVAGHVSSREIGMRCPSAPAGAAPDTLSGVPLQRVRQSSRFASWSLSFVVGHVVKPARLRRLY